MLCDREIFLIPTSDRANHTADINQVFLLDCNTKFQLEVSENKDVTFFPLND